MNSDHLRKIQLLRAGARVERCHFIPHSGSYSVAAHTFGMLSLLMVLHPRPSLNLIRAITFHDASHESIIGDIPISAKRLYRPIAEAYVDAQIDIEQREGFWVDLNQEEQLWLSGLDIAEFLHWCEDQLFLGNRHVAVWQGECIRYLTKFVNDEEGNLHENLRDYMLHLIRN